MNKRKMRFSVFVIDQDVIVWVHSSFPHVTTLQARSWWLDYTHRRRPIR
jgi:hypothetical protein